jgi:protein-disulfide isomerase
MGSRRRHRRIQQERQEKPTDTLKAKRNLHMTLIPRTALAIAAAVLLAWPATASAQSFSPDQRHQIETIIKDYLTSHPEVMQDILAAVDKHQKDTAAAKTAATIRADQATLFNSPHQVVLGNPKGSITAVEFFDYNCAFCKHALPDMMNLLQSNPDLRFVLKEFPVLGPGSVDAAHVAVAARMQDPTGAKYIEFHQRLLGGRGVADLARALAVAKEVGYDMARIQRDMNSPEVKTTIDEDMKLADDIGVDGTPSYVIGNEVVIGAVGFDELKQKITDLKK